MIQGALTPVGAFLMPIFRRSDFIGNFIILQSNISAAQRLHSKVKKI